MQGHTPYLFYNFITYPYPYYISTPQISHPIHFYPQNSTLEELPMLSLESLPIISENTDIRLEQPLQPHQSPVVSQIPAPVIKPRSKRSSKKKSKKRRYNMTKRNQNALFTSYQLKNGTSNILRSFIRGLVTRQCDGLVREILQRLGGSCQQAEEFYEWISSYKINTQKFIKRALVFQILSHSDRERFRQALRIILYRFLRYESLTRIMTTNRYSFKWSQFLGRRILIRQLEELMIKKYKKYS